MHSFKKKIRILEKILKDQGKHLETCKRIDCIIEKKKVIIRKISVHGENHNTQIRFPKRDIDAVIKRERSKLIIYNKSKDIDEAIKEIELIDKIKTITG